MKIHRMPDATFWQVVEHAHLSGHNESDVYAYMYSYLCRQPPEEVLSYGCTKARYSILAQNNDIYTAYHIIPGGGGYDFFMGFVTWLVYQGQAVYDAVMRDINALLIFDNNIDVEWREDLPFVEARAYQYITGEDFGVAVETRCDPIEVVDKLKTSLLDPAKFPKQYPELWLKFRGVQGM